MRTLYLTLRIFFIKRHKKERKKVNQSCKQNYLKTNNDNKNIFLHVLQIKPSLR